jgi:uncharacterized protein YecA (UPF0149 family)
MTALNSVDQAIEVSQKILEAIDHSDLVLVASLEQERQSFITKYFSVPDHKDENQIRLLKELNDDILNRLTEMQSQIRSQHSSLAQATKASKAYLDNA